MIEIAALGKGGLHIDHLTIGPGTTFLIGENGGGKTTLLRLLSGIDRPDTGDISIDGQPPREKNVGWVNEYPDRSLLFSVVHDEIASALRFQYLPCDEVAQNVRNISTELGIAHLLERPVHELSGGERVLVSVAAALVSRPDLLILDDSDSHVDNHSRRRIERAIMSVSPRYVIRCTQMMETAAAGDIVIALHLGRVAAQGTPQVVFGALKNTPFYPVSWRNTT